jgi:hypothetical protein
MPLNRCLKCEILKCTRFIGEGLPLLLWRLLTAAFQRLTLGQLSPGKNIRFPLMPAASTEKCLLPAGFDMLCHLTHTSQPLMRFLFVSTNFCSPASFRLRLTADALAAC